MLTKDNEGANGVSGKSPTKKNVTKMENIDLSLIAGNCLQFWLWGS